MSETSEQRIVPGLGKKWLPEENHLSLFDHVKQIAWNVVFPIFPYLRDSLLAFGIIRHIGRQPYHIGHLVPGKTANELKEHLERNGFDECRIAWEDEGEIVNLRRRVSFKYQYHLRLFNDGEIRGHYELTPESNPIDHMLDRETSGHTEEFLEFLDGWIRDSA